MLRVGDRVVLKGNMLTALGTATGSSQQGQGQIQPPEEQTIQPEDQPPVTEGQTDEERNAAKREAKEKMKKERAGAEQQPTDGSPISDHTYRFNPQNLIIDEFNGIWAVKDSASPDRAIYSCLQERKSECELVLAFLQFYGISEQIFTCGDIGMTIYLASGSAPSGPYPGVKCRSFNPEALTIQQGTVVSSQVSGTPDWEILENGELFFRIAGNLGPSDEATAQNIVNLIQQYGFNIRCYLTSGFYYMRK